MTHDTQSGSPITDFTWITIPPNRSRLIINHGLRFEMQAPPPNRWRRFWYWTLLGWKWEAMR
jgi:hypothetical protein